MICLTSIDRFIGGYAEDGVCTEGIAYWGYGFGYFMCFADLLKRRTGGKLDLFAIEKVHLMATFIGKVFFPKGRSLSFSDGGSRSRSNPSTVSFLKTIYPDMPTPSAEAMVFKYPTDTNYRFALALRKFVNMQEDPFVPTEGLDTCYIFPAAQWYLSTTKNREISIAAKAGHNAEAHNHNDVGSFQIFKNGEQILADIGAGAYDKTYFSAAGNLVFCKGSHGHNVPLINGKTQSYGRAYSSENTVIERSGLAYDFHKAYDEPTLEKLHRDIRFDDVSGAVTLKDSFFFSEAPSALVERFVTEFEPVIEDGNVLIDGKGEKMSLYYDKSSWNVEIGVERKARGATQADHVFYHIDFSPKSLDKNLKFELEIK
jgi:hypothetical protein